MKIHSVVKFVAISAMASLFASGVVHAAEPAFVSKVKGKGVSLTRDGKELPVQTQTLLKDGDRLAAPAGSRVEITYFEDNCTLRVPDGGSIIVSGASPCQAGKISKSEASAEVKPAPSSEQSSKIIPAAADVGAATVTSANGPMARVNQGQGLLPVKNGATLKVGDKVFAGMESSVTVYFVEANCYVTVSAGDFLTISTTPPCKPPAAPQNLAQVEKTEAGLPTTTSDQNGVAIVVGGTAVVAATVAAVLLLNEDDDNDNDPGNPVTP